LKHKADFYIPQASIKNEKMSKKSTITGGRGGLYFSLTRLNCYSTNKIILVLLFKKFLKLLH